ncbi:hypothetical protein [Pseudonocardia alaniniphila]|nr:hypothetical protein [Pseudonocardia alaniniphila]
MSHRLQGPCAGLINTPSDQELHRHDHVPASNTAVGHIVPDAAA